MGNKVGGGPGRAKQDPRLEARYDDHFKELKGGGQLGEGTGPFGSTPSHNNIFEGRTQEAGDARALAETLAGDRHKYELKTGGWVAYYGRSAVSFRPRTDSDPTNPGITLTHFTSGPNGGLKTVYRIHIKEPQ